MSSDLVKAIAKVRELRRARGDVKPEMLGKWQADYSSAHWRAVALFTQEYLGGD